MCTSGKMEYHPSAVGMNGGIGRRCGCRWCRKGGWWVVVHGWWVVVVWWGGGVGVGEVKVKRGSKFQK